MADEVSHDFHLRSESSLPGSKGATSLVWAGLKPGRSHPLLSAALMEIDEKTDELIRLVLWTIRDGRPNGTVAYNNTLVDRVPQGDDFYRLETHLDPDAEIEFQSSQPTTESAPKAHVLELEN